MYRPVLVTAAATMPVTRTEAKSHLRVDGTTEDTLIDGLIAAAVSYFDGWSGVLGRALVTQTWRQDYDDFRSCLRLPLFPVASVTIIQYIDTSGATQTVGPENYSLLSDDRGFYVRFKDSYGFPALNADGPAVKVTYVAGVADTDVEKAIKQAILLLIGHFYANREAVVVGVAMPSKVPMAVDALIAPFRRIAF